MRITEGEGDKRALVSAVPGPQRTYRGLVRTGGPSPNGTNRPTPLNHSLLVYCFKHRVEVQHIHKTTNSQLEMQLSFPQQPLKIDALGEGRI